MMNFTQSSSLSLSSLPDEIVESFLARIPRSYYWSLCLVSKHFYSLLSCPKIYNVRSHIGATEPCLYVCLWVQRSNKHTWFTLFNPRADISDRVYGLLCPQKVRLSSSYDPVRLNSITVAVGSEIYQIGGTVDDKPSKAVDVLDCRSQTWRRAPDLTVARESAQSCFLDGKIYVIGGEEDSIIWGEFFDVKTQTWKLLPKLLGINGLVDSDYQVLALGTRLCVITKHNNKYAYDPKEGRWLPDVGFLGLVEPVLTGPCCVIDNILFAEHGGQYKWYDSRCGGWLMVENLENLYGRRFLHYRTVQLVNHGGKLVTIWHEWQMFGDWGPPYRRICCAVIRLEKRATPFRTKIRGVIEWCNIIAETIHKSYKLLSCQSICI